MRNISHISEIKFPHSKIWNQQKNTWTQLLYKMNLFRILSLPEPASHRRNKRKRSGAMTTKRELISCFSLLLLLLLTEALQGEQTIKCLWRMNNSGQVSEFPEFRLTGKSHVFREIGREGYDSTVNQQENNCRRTDKDSDPSVEQVQSTQSTNTTLQNTCVFKHTANHN